MQLYDAIFQRKSCRSYLPTPLSEKTLNEIDKAVASFAPLYPDMPLTHRFTSQAKGLSVAQAPHYLIISGRGLEGERENAGFLYEHLALWLDAHDIGCIWLGGAKDKAKNPNGKDIIAIALGQASEPVHRNRGDFKRQPIEEITNDPGDACVQAVHMAPSGLNLQPWYIEKKGDTAIFHKKLPRPPASLIYKFTDLDMGIALCHYALGCEQMGKPFAFKRLSGASPMKGYELFGEVRS